MARLVVDRYELFRELASGGMATVWLGRLRGESGFTRIVAVKRLHPHLARNPQFVTMLVDEARLASRIRHPNVVSTVDVVRHEEELLLVMEYVHGESLSRILEHVRAAGASIPLPVIGAIVSGMLQGLHAAHEARDEQGEPLHIVHRDVSPQNVLVGADGVARVVDFGVAKAAGRLQESSGGQVKGKVAYMAPEQLTGTADRRTDIFAASVVLWELLTSRRLFASPTEVETITKILSAPIPSPRDYVPELSALVEELVMAGLDRAPARRFANAREMDQALHRCIPVASTFDVAEWLNAMLGTSLEQRAKLVSEAETSGPQSTNVSFADLAAINGVTPPGEVPTRFAGGSVDDSLVGLQSARTSPARRFGLVAFLGLLIGVVGWLALAASHDHQTTVDTALRDGSAGPAFAIATTSASVAPDTTAVANEPPSTDDGEAGALAHTIPDAAATHAATAKPTGHLPPPVPPRRRPKVNCDPPYVIDAKGQHWKEECLN